MKTVLSVVYASAPNGEVIIPTLEIIIPGEDSIRICGDYADHDLGVNGVYQRFQATAMSVALPAKNDSGQQTLSFGIAGIDAQAQRAVKRALETGALIVTIFREYLASDKSQPASKPRIMELTGGSLKKGQSVFEASYYDMLNASWPRERYTAQNAPGLKYQ